MANIAYALTTHDNPFDPFDEFEQWFLFDVEKGYNSCAYLDRIANVTNDMTENEMNKAIEQAIDEIVANDVTFNYKKVAKQQAKEE